MASNRRSLLTLVLMVAVLMAGIQWWASRQQAALGQQLAARAEAGDIRMLSSTTCSICASARSWFKIHGVKFDECFIETDRDCAILFEATRSPGTPVILVRGKPLVGFDPERIRVALGRS